MSPGVEWSLGKRLAFRFGVIAAALYVYPLPFGVIPYTDSIAEALGKPWQWLVVWFSESVLGAGTPPIQPTGSGDTLFSWVSFLVLVLVSALGAAVWSALDRRRLAYPRLASATWIGLRYLLAFTLFSYGFAKLVNTQFPAPSPAQLDERVGEMSPMGLLWTFQGASTAYTFFGGLAEAVAGTLLLWRRTATLGALLAMAVMTNVVMLNFCYDVPVKLYSMQLLAIAALIALPQLRRLLRASLGHAVGEVPPRPRSSQRRERARIVAKLGAIALLGYSIYSNVHAASEYVRPASELQGVWKVETWTEHGRPAKARWRKLIVTEWAAVVVDDDGQQNWVRAEVIPGLQLLVVQTRQYDLWQYARPEPGRMIIDRVEGGTDLRITLSREPEPLLVTRGFHWIQEFPFNR
ncbi:MAG TPA: hypothetical protein VFS15_13215 [Kofleriaceae bacterium]|nr:hypothetical protein [Kofleriaceae bacterium]